MSGLWSKTLKQKQSDPHTEKRIAIFKRFHQLPGYTPQPPLGRLIAMIASRRESETRKAAEAASDLTNKRMIADATYIIGLYSSNPSLTSKVHTFEERNKIDQLIGALETAKRVNKTNEYDGVLDSLKRILADIQSVKSFGGKRKTRRKRRRTTRSSK